MDPEPGFEDWLNGMLSDSEPDALARWLPRLRTQIDMGEMVILRETGFRLSRDGSVAGTWRLVRLRNFVMLLAMRAPDHLSHVLMSIWEELELGAAGPTGTDAQVLNYRGCLLAEQERFDSAAQQLTAAIEADAAFVPAYINRAKVLLELDRPDEALADVEAAVTFDPDYPRARFTARLVGILIAIGKLRPPLYALLAGEHGLLYYLRTYDRPLRPRELPDQSLWDEKAITPLPRPGPDAGAAEWNHVGVVDGRVGRYAESISAFEAALDLDPGYSRARYNLARARQLAGDHDRAVAGFTELIELGGDLAQTYRARACSYRALWRIEDARSDVAAAEQEEGVSAGCPPPDLPDLSELLRAMAREPVNLQPWEPEVLESGLAHLSALKSQGLYREMLDVVLRRLLQRPAPTPVLQAQLYELHAVALAGLDQREAAQERYLAALELLADGSAPRVKLRCLQAYAGCFTDPADARRATSLEKALMIALALGDRLTEGRLRARLARDAEERSRPNAAASWYRSALLASQEAEDWGTSIAVLDTLADLADRLHGSERADEYRAARDQAVREAGDLAVLGPSAPPRPEFLQAARDTLLARAPSMPLNLGGSAEDITVVLDHADRLRRKLGRPADSLPCYYAALALCWQLDDHPETAGCLTGMGSAYETLAGEAAGEAMLAHVREDPRDNLQRGSLVSGLVATMGHALIAGEAGALTECARAAYRLALEHVRSAGDLTGQAMQISNLAVIEARLGNVDTAVRYDQWALGVHERAHQQQHARIDLGHLLDMAERLGEKEKAAELRRRWEELRNAAPA